LTPHILLSLRSPALETTGPACCVDRLWGLLFLHFQLEISSLIDASPFHSKLRRPGTREYGGKKVEDTIDIIELQCTKVEGILIDWCPNAPSMSTKI